MGGSKVVEGREGGEVLGGRKGVIEGMGVKGIEGVLEERDWNGG